MIKRLRDNFFAGLMVLIPVFVTFYIIYAIYITIDRFIRPVILVLFGRYIPGLGLLVTIALVLLVGLIGKNVFGHRLFRLGELAMNKIPLVKQVYTTLKQIMDAFFNTTTLNAFKQVVLIEYPQTGLYRLGFVTHTGVEEFKQATGADLVNVFVPTTPNATSGMLIMVPRDKMVPVEMAVEDGIKLILSGGVLAPVKKDEVVVRD